MGVAVFGGTGVLGQACCRLLHRDGGLLGFSHYSQDGLARRMAAEFASQTFYCDINREQTIAECAGLFQQHPLNGVIISLRLAGQPLIDPQSGKAVSLRQQDDTWAGRYAEFYHRGIVRICRHMSEPLAGGGGNIVIIAGLIGIKPIAAPAYYAAAQAGIKGLTISMAKELGADNIRVNMIAAGLHESPQANELGSIKRDYLKYSAAKRLAMPEEIAEVAIWFARHNTYVSGQAIVLDGGL